VGGLPTFILGGGFVLCRYAPNRWDSIALEKIWSARRNSAVMAELLQYIK
jgi:hypothetical protein